jgi:hypothetical protein
MRSTVEAIADLVLAGITREYPNQIPLTFFDASDAKTPKQIFPAFYGCYDWHSAVHAHWTLVRLVRCYPRAPFVSGALDVLEKHITPANVARELAWIERRPGFERPYGLAWLLKLEAELRTCGVGALVPASKALKPLADLARRRFQEWLPKLEQPIRTGTHNQTAFALGLLFDASRDTCDLDARRFVRDRGLAYYERDRNYAIHLEPSGEDFLSQSLGAADFMRRLLDEERFADWLGNVFPGLLGGGKTWLEPVRCSDRSDGRLAHLDGLNLSRAWMLDAIANALPQRDLRVRSLRASADAHREAGLAAVAVAHEHYEGAHWLGTFATYLLTGAAHAPPGT